MSSTPLLFDLEPETRLLCHTNKVGNYVVDRPNSTILHLDIHLCKYTNLKDTAGQSARNYEEERSFTRDRNLIFSFNKNHPLSPTNPNDLAFGPLPKDTWLNMDGALLRQKQESLCQKETITKILDLWENFLGKYFEMTKKLHLQNFAS